MPRAVVCRTNGDFESLKLETVPRAPLGDSQVRVTLHAAGLNFPDALMVKGTYQHKPPLPFVPGLEAAGVVSQVGLKASGFAVGDRVMVGLMPVDIPTRPSSPLNASPRCPTTTVSRRARYFASATRPPITRSSSALPWRPGRRCWCMAPAAANAYALHFAAEAADLAVVRQLVEAGADVAGDGDDHRLGVLGWATCFRSARRRRRRLPAVARREAEPVVGHRTRPRRRRVGLHQGYRY